MNLIQFLSEGEHPVEVSLRPHNTFERFQESVNRGYVHIKFTDTRGGTELGIEIDRGRSDLSAMRAGNSGAVLLAGSLTLDHVPVTCVAKIGLATLAGTGRFGAARELVSHAGGAIAGLLGVCRAFFNAHRESQSTS